MSLEVTSDGQGSAPGHRDGAHPDSHRQPAEGAVGGGEQRAAASVREQAGHEAGADDAGQWGGPMRPELASRPHPRPIPRDRPVPHEVVRRRKSTAAVGTLITTAAASQAAAIHPALPMG
jgi:hypothetical protein